jgi:hypothetical protein
MALASSEDGMEARIARLESDVSHIRTDLVDVKQDVRELRARVDKGFDETRNGIDSLQTELASAKVWALILFIAQAGAVYGTLARAMGWI